MQNTKKNEKKLYTYWHKSSFLFGRAGAAAETTHANKYRRRAVGLYAAMAGNQRKRHLSAPPS